MYQILSSRTRAVFRRSARTVGLLIAALSASAAMGGSASTGIQFSAIKTAQSAGSLEAMVVDTGDFFTIRKLSHSAILVTHPAGDLLYDTGIGVDVVAQMEAFNFFDQQLFAIEEHNPAVTQLANNGYSLSSLKAIIVGHMHWDHVSGLEDFIGTPVWTTEAALAEAKAGQPPGFVMSQFDDPRIDWQFMTLASGEYMGFDQSLDVYGDGSAVIVDISGHADGHMGLFVNLDNGQRYFFIGDATWALKGVEKNKSRPSFVQWMTGVDKDVEKNAAVVEKIHQLSRAYPELSIVPAHDEIVLRGLPRYPGFSPPK